MSYHIICRGKVSAPSLMHAPDKAHGGALLTFSQYLATFQRLSLITFLFKSACPRVIGVNVVVCTDTCIASTGIRVKH